MEAEVGKGEAGRVLVLVDGMEGEGGGRRVEAEVGKGEAGQVMVLVGLVAMGLFLAAALVVDIGAAYAARRSLQTSVDAAALAAAQDIVERRGAEAARATAENYVVKNAKLPVDSVSVTFPGQANVRVEAKVRQETFFARAVGREAIDVGSRATASMGLAGKVYNLVPVIVPFQRIAGHVGPDNGAVFELGSDRPIEELSILYSQSGSQVTYTVTYVNSSSKSQNTEVWSPIPSGAAYVAGSATACGSFDGANVRWNWKNIGPGDRRTASYVVGFAGQINIDNLVYAKVSGGATQSASTNTSQQGYFWLTDFTGGSAGTPELAEWIENGYPGAVGLGGTANGTGVRASLKSAMANRISSDPTVVLPLYDYTQGGGHGGEYHVAGFAEFYITDFDFSGNPKSISGYFTDGTVTPGVGTRAGEFEGEPVDFGVMAIWLSD